ncbi:BatA domain-containing protein [Hymenobacter cellulosivorans]|uniref:BatA domain-containing protein n=1 Tax=Hymenobacter cellulosivorans TaxID=2932249 RepID=A0ABY4F7J0_9BACT|nr:BatA domain-containing protein [Hymenobacter cellulosivorans]UOQ52626.1 BatA domain-containing protein [Hymenobacter cellulosivorans]
MALTYPWFLLGLLAVGIPIAIHFFELRRPQRVLFTNVSFIREIKLVTARQRKLKHLLILAARIGFIAFLVLLFCLPYIPAPEQGQSPGGVVTTILDASPSMAVEGEDGQALFEQAIEQADQLPTAYPASARYLFPTASNSLLTANAFQTTLQQAGISGQAKSINTLVDRAQRAAGIRQTFIFSDFQRNSFSAQALKADTLNQTYLVPLRGKQTANVYVDSVLLDDAFVRSGSDIGLRVRLRNGGTQAATDCQVKIFVGNRQVAAFRTAIGAHASTTSAVRVRLDSPALQQCRVEVEDLPVTFDNTYFFTLQTSPQIGILNLAGPQETAVGRVYRNEAMFAFASSNQNLDYSRLNAANLIILEEMPKISNALRENLVRAVNQGATLVIVPPVAGPDAQAEYTRLLTNLGIGGVQWQVNPGAASVLQDVAAPALQNPFFQDVFSASNQRAVMPKVAPVLRWSRSGTDVLKMRSGDGFLAGFSSGKGNVYLFSAPFGPTYSNFTQHALFVPVMYRLAMRSYRSEQRLAYRLNQNTIALGIPVQQGSGQRDEPVVSLRRDSLTVIPAQRWEGGSLRLTLPAVVQEPGFYEVVYNNKVLTTLALNLDKAESELAYYSAAELRQLIGPNQPNIQVYEGGTDRSVAAHYKAQRVGTPLWRYCLLLALGCLLAEVLLLRFMGSRKPQPVAAVTA